MKKKNEPQAEPFFLEIFNTDAIFRSVDRKDYIFLYYIKQCAEHTGDNGKVYLSDLADVMQMEIPEVSGAIERLYDNGLVTWKTDVDLGKTFVTLTSKAVELMSDELKKMKKSYAMIRKAIGDEEFEHTLYTLKRIRDILQDVGKSDV